MSIIRRIPLMAETQAAYRQWLIALLNRGDVDSHGLAILSGIKNRSRLTHIIKGQTRPTDQLMVSTMAAVDDNFFTTLTDEGFLDLSLGFDEEDDGN